MLKSLTSLLRGGEEEIIASNQPLDLTSSSLGIFFLVFIMNLPEGNDDPSLGLLVGDSGSVSILLQEPKMFSNKRSYSKALVLVFFIQLFCQ